MSESENDLNKEINREELKKWAIEEVKKYGVKNTTIRFGRVSKKWHGTTKTKIIDGEKHFVITIHKGENLEEIKDELDVEMFKDTVKHEICHVLAGSEKCEYHSGHDKLWKHYAVLNGVFPASRSGRLSFSLWKKGINATVLGTPLFVRLNVYRKDDEYYHFGLQVDPFKRSIGSVIVHCNVCDGYWVVGKEDATYYCGRCEVEVSPVDPDPEKIREFNRRQEEVVEVREDEEEEE